MANVNYNVIKKVAVNLGIDKKIDKLYEKTQEYINYRYLEVKQGFEDLEVLVNKILSEELTDEDDINKMCYKYVLIDTELANLFELHEDIKENLDVELKEVFETYVQATSYFCNGGVSEIYAKASCLILTFMQKFNDWATDIIVDNVDKLTDMHNQLAIGLEYIFNIIREEELEIEINDDIQSFVDNKILYIASAKDMEDIAIKSGYKFKSQKGSHRKYEHKTTHKCIVIPFHNEDLKLGTSLGIQKKILANAI